MTQRAIGCWESTQYQGQFSIIALSLAGYQLTVSHMCVMAQRVMNMKMLYLSLLSESNYLFSWVRLVRTKLTIVRNPFKQYKIASSHQKLILLPRQNLNQLQSRGAKCSKRDANANNGTGLGVGSPWGIRTSRHQGDLAATNSWLLTFDNLSGIPTPLSDALYRLS